MPSKLDRQEWLEQKLREAKAADGTPIAGKKATAVRVQDRVYKAYEPTGVKARPLSVEKKFDLPIIQKRSPAERAQSMGGRLWEAALKDPAQMQLLLQRVQGYLWESGKPIAYDDIKVVADELIRMAEQKEQEKYSKMVSH